MNAVVRKFFPYLIGVVALGALAWAVSFGTLPRADFAFNNGDEIQTVDPPKATGQPEGRVIFALFEGLMRQLPDGIQFDDQGNITHYPDPRPDGNVRYTPQPAMAERYTVSDDGLTYTFHIRQSALWSDNSPVTAHDFVFSWQRMLHPDTASQYAYQLSAYVVNADKYNGSKVDVGDRVEVELNDRPKGPDGKKATAPFPRGTIRRGVLRQIARPPEPVISDATPKEERDEILADWKRNWIYLVEVKPGRDGEIDWETKGRLAAFSKNKGSRLAAMEMQRARKSPAAEAENDSAAEPHPLSQVDFRGEVTRCLHTLIDFDSSVGIRVEPDDDYTLVVTLNNPTSYFLELVAFYPLYPVNRRCVERYGEPDWTKPENIVCNGPYTLQFRRIRDRVRLVKNPHYWNAKAVKLNVIDAFAVKSQTTELNMYLNGQLDWSADPPNKMIDDLKRRSDFVSAPGYIIYFYRLNVTKPPLNDKRVRQALNMAIDKSRICEEVTRAGQSPARTLVPPVLPGYRSPQCGPYDPQRAKQLLAEAGYHSGPGGKRLPKLQVLFNTSESHREIAEVIQRQWKNELGIDADLKNSEWQSYLDAVRELDFVVARAGWIGDYSDPNTFLDMWLTGGENNQTGWGNEQYDALIEAAKKEIDPERRKKILYQAEEILMDELPIIPIYYYVTINLVQPHVKGFSPNIQDLHPLHILRVEP